MNDRKYKRENKPSACTQPPWAMFIPAKDRPEILRIIRQEVIDKKGYHYDECPNRKTCLKKTCMGRPLPYESETAIPYLKELEKISKIDNGLLFIETDCSKCPVAKTCSIPCNQVLDYIDRDKSLEPSIEFYENHPDKKNEPYSPSLSPDLSVFTSEDIPWDILPEHKVNTIKKYLYEERDFRHVAETMGLHNQAAAKYNYYNYLTKLSEFGVMRKFIKRHGHELTDSQQQILDLIYFKNLKSPKVAELLGMSKQSVRQTISRIVSRYNLTWAKFVTKRQKKTTYYIPKVLK